MDQFLAPIQHQPGDLVVSPSQIAVWRLCRRKWGYRSLEKLPDPGTPDTARGKRVHSLLEDWSVHGKQFDRETPEGRIAAKLQPHAPPPGVAVAEGYFTFEAFGIRYRGIQDLAYREVGRLVVHDWKTTSDLKWALSEEELKSDPQALIYGLRSVTQYRATEVALKWVYGTSGKKPRSRVVQAVLSVEEIYQAFLLNVHKHAREMVLTARATKKAELLPKNLSACHKYRGCPYKGTACHITQRERLEALMEHDSLRNRVAEQQQTNGAGAYPQAVPPHLIVQQNDGSLAAQTPYGLLPVYLNPSDGQYYPAQQQASAAVPQQLAHPPPGAPAQAPAVPQQVQMPTHQPMDINQPVSQAPAQVQSEQEPEPEPAPPAVEKPKRGRKPGAKTRVLTLEQQIWLSGVQATMANPTLANGQLTEDLLVKSGNKAIAAFHARFGED